MASNRQFDHVCFFKNEVLWEHPNYELLYAKNKGVLFIFVFYLANIIVQKTCVSLGFRSSSGAPKKARI